jgi:nucleoside-diphosphate-sugar epimerase
MRMLVTGGTGFIGSQVVDLLAEEGHEVLVFARRTELPGRWRGRRVALAAGDLADADSLLAVMQGRDVLFHIGELKVTSRSAARKNVRLVARIVGALGASGIGRLVFVSSITVAGVPQTVPAAEETPAAAVLNDHYTAYKREGERIIAEGAGDADYAVIRPGVVYGPGSRSMRAMAGIIASAGAVGLPWVGRGGNLMPLVHVKDLARAVVLAGTAPAAARQTFNLTDGERHTWQEFFGAVAATAGRTPRILPLPPGLLRLPAAFGGAVASFFGIQADLPSYVTYLSRDVHFSMRKAERLLGWKAVHTDVRAGVREMMEQGS